jgi:hypothetical protein
MTRELEHTMIKIGGVYSYMEEEELFETTVVQTNVGSFYNGL